MKRSAAPAEFLPGLPLPSWAAPSPAAGAGEGAAAAFQAGAALLALDQVVRAEPPWLGTLRMRQALLAAAATAKLLGQREDDRALRDAEHLTGTRDDPGPAGHLHRAWRWLATWPVVLEGATIARLCAGLGRPAAAAPALALADADGDPIARAARAAALAVEGRGGLTAAEAGVLGLMLADLVLARALRWSVPVPLLAAAIAHPSLRCHGRRPAPGESGWEAACYAGYGRAAAAAYQCALDLSARHDRLCAAAIQIRTRNRDAALGRLLADDAVTPASLSGLGSDRAARRFCDRLVELGGIRELSGRATFRLYGL